jgi:adhesin transport system outer membrane protein
VHLALALLLVGAAPAVQAQTLGDELRDLVANHPQIRAKVKTQSAAEQGIGVARSAYYPTARLAADAGPEYYDTVDRLNTQGKPYMRGTTDSSGMVVTQRLYDGQATDANVSSAQVTHSLSGAVLRATRHNAILEGIKAYLSILRLTHLINLSSENVHIVQSQLKLEDERVVKGAGMGADVLLAKQRLQVAKEARVRYVGEMDTAVANYTQVFGHTPVADALSEPVVPAQVLDNSIENAMETAEKNNPSLEAAKLSIDLSAQKQRGAEAGYMPTVDLVGKADFQHDKLTETGDRKDWSVLVTATWEFFSGWKTQSQVAQASYEHGAAMDNNLYQTRKVKELVRTSWAKLHTARERMGLLENAANLAEELLQASQKLHKAGKETIFNVLDAENRMIQSRIDYAQAYYDMASATYEILNAMGLLELDIIDAVPEGRANIPLITNLPALGVTPPGAKCETQPGPARGP